MVRVISRCRSLGLGAAASWLLSVFALGFAGPAASPPARAGEMPHAVAKPTADGPTWVEVVRQTQTSGTPAVLIVTSASVPSSRLYARTLSQSLSAARQRGQFGVAELTIEDEPEQARRLGVSTYPTLIAYRRGQGGRLESAGVYRGSLSGEALGGWLLGLGLSQNAAPAPASAVAGPAPAPGDDGQVRRAQYPIPAPGPSPQQPMYYPPSPPKVAPPTPYPPAPTPRVVYKTVPRKEVVTRRVRVVPREVEVVEVPRRRVIREVEEPAPRSLLTQPREAEEEVVEVREVEAPAPREEEVEVREVEVPAPREVVRVREVEAPAREVVRVREVEVPAARAVEQPAQVALIQPNVVDRFLGRIGRGLATRGNPRVAVESRQEMVTLAAAPRAVAIAAPKEAAPCHKCGRHCRGTCTPVEPNPGPPQGYAPPAYSYPPSYTPPYAPSPQAPH